MQIRVSPDKLSGGKKPYSISNILGFCGAPACCSMVMWAERGHRDWSKRPKWGLSYP